MVFSTWAFCLALDSRLRGLCLVEGQILPFPVDFAGRPYNSATLYVEVLL